MFKRREFDLIRSRLLESRRFIQLVLGPRQVGKTTVVKQVLEAVEIPSLYYLADDAPAGAAWLSACWEKARLKAQTTPNREIVLVIDEIQKIPNWTEVVKCEWDRDSWEKRPIKLLLVGSSRALVMDGLTESLMGRFEEICMTHWSYSEMREAYGLTLDEFIYCGGYPGPAPFVKTDRKLWRDMVIGPVIEAALNHDVFEDGRIGKPALLRRTFELGIRSSGKCLSLTKLLGEIQDAGNVMTIAGYVERLNQCGLLATLSKFSSGNARKRASIPKFQVHNTGLCAALSPEDLAVVKSNPVLWDGCVKSAVGAYLVSQAYKNRFDVMYWRDGSDAVDFVLRIRGKIIALEVKRNFERYTRGLQVFTQKFHPHRALIIGDGGLPLETFLTMDVMELAK